MNKSINYEKMKKEEILKTIEKQKGDLIKKII